MTVTVNEADAAGVLLPTPVTVEQWSEQAPHYRQLLLEELKLLRIAQGWPSPSEMERNAAATGGALGRHSIQQVFVLHSGRAPTWPAVRRVVEVLGGDLRYFYPLHMRAVGTGNSMRRFRQYQAMVVGGLPTLGTNVAGDVPEPAQRPDPLPAELEFVAMLPDRARNRRSEQVPHEQWAEAMRARPGQWARIRAGLSAGYSSQICQGRIRAFQPAGSFESVVRGGEIYARYVGG